MNESNSDIGEKNVVVETKEITEELQSHTQLTMQKTFATISQ